MSWPRSASDYAALVDDENRDSRYLRERGLIPNLLYMAGSCKDATLLDAGTGTGWIFQHIRPAAAYACDIVSPKSLPDWVKFSQDNLETLSYQSIFFDVVICSLVLMFCEKVDLVCSELNRVTKPGGRLLISLTHPYFYRTGGVTKNGSFLIDHNLSNDSEIEIEIGGHVGPFTYYYRPYPYYMNTLINSGWTIRSVRDWFIDVKEHSRLTTSGVHSRIRRSGNVPLYTFVECNKTN